MKYIAYYDNELVALTQITKENLLSTRTIWHNNKYSFGGVYNSSAHTIDDYEEEFNKGALKAKILDENKLDDKIELEKIKIKIL
jgi:hypothetical protein